MDGKHSFLKSRLSMINPPVEKCSLAAIRRSQESIGKIMTNSCRDRVSTERIKVDGINCAMLTPKLELSGGVVLYIHGGGYVAGNLDYAKGFGSALAVRCGIRVFAVEYRLAPENPYTAAIDDVLGAYGYLLSAGYKPSDIALCGDDAGGALCYTLCQKLRDKGWTMPAGIIAISPWTDLTLSSPSYEINKNEDKIMSVQKLKYFADCYTYGGEADTKGKLRPKVNHDVDDDIKTKRDPKLSPLFDSQEKMPDSLIFVDGDEIMYDDSILLHKKLLAAGCVSELVIAHGLWHGYVMYDLPERKGDFEKIAKFIKRIIPTNRKLAWMALDNAAKLYPSARSRTWINVFRISSTLDEEIDREALRVALDVTVRRFPSIAVAIKPGMFWYYLEEIKAPPELLDEKPFPLARMRMKDMNKCAFRVLVYKNRFAVEFFHSLTDGNGALIFVKTLTAEYLYQKYGIKVPTGNGIFDRLEEPSREELEDSFMKYAGDYAASRKDTNSFQIRANREVDGFITSTSFVIDADYVKREAKARGVTVTVYMTAMLIEATQRIQHKLVGRPARYKPIKVCVPVNLRSLFPSQTLRNFIMFVNLGIDPRVGEYEFDDLCQILAAQMKQQLTKRNMAAVVRKNVESEMGMYIRIAPLFIKNFLIKTLYILQGESKTCFSYSNLGVVAVPPEYSSKVKRMDFLLGARANGPYNVTSLTYNGKMYLNVTRNTKKPILEREIFEVLRENGVPHTVESNTRGKEQF